MGRLATHPPAPRLPLSYNLSTSPSGHPPHNTHSSSTRGAPAANALQPPTRIHLAQVQHHPPDVPPPARPPTAGRQAHNWWAPHKSVYAPFTPEPPNAGAGVD